MDPVTDNLRDRLMCLYENGKIEAVLACINKLLILRPNDMITFRRTISCLEKIGRLDLAIEWCDKAIEADPLSSEFYIKKIYLLSKEKIGEISECFNKLMQLYPNHNHMTKPASQFAWKWLVTQEEKAIDICDRLLSLDLKEKEAFNVHMAKYNILMRLQRPSDAWTFLDEVITSNRYQRLRPKYSCMKENLRNKIQSVEINQGAIFAFCYILIFMACYFGFDWGLKKSLLLCIGFSSISKYLRQISYILTRIFLMIFDELKRYYRDPSFGSRKKMLLIP